MDISKSVTITIDDICSKETFRALDEASAQALLETIITYCTIVYEASTSQHTIPKQVISLSNTQQKRAA